MQQYFIQIAELIDQIAFLRILFITAIILILYQVWLKKYFKDIHTALVTFPEKIDKIDKIDMLDNLKGDVDVIKIALKDMVYSDLIDKVAEVKTLGGKTHHQDEKFQAKWKVYIALGDGNGNGPLDDWNKISWITDEQYYAKTQQKK